jgi:hypothetical protein
MPKELEFRDYMFIKLYFRSPFVRRLREREFREVLERYGLTEEEAKEIAEKPYVEVRMPLIFLGRE